MKRKYKDRQIIQIWIEKTLKEKFKNKINADSDYTDMTHFIETQIKIYTNINKVTK